MLQNLVLAFACTAIVAGPAYSAERGKAGEQADRTYRSHPPVRPLPRASGRPLAKGPALFVDTLKGNDANNGSTARPWKTVAAAVKRLKPGDTLYLRGGTFYEQVTLTASGAQGKPITLCSYPGELAILDGGFRQFADDPANAWEPVAGDVPGGCSTADSADRQVE